MTFQADNIKQKHFLIFLAENSLSSNLYPSIIKFRKEEEQKQEYKDASPNQCHYLNFPLQYNEFIVTLESFASNSTAAGIDGISYQMLKLQKVSFRIQTFCLLEQQLVCEFVNSQQYWVISGLRSLVTTMVQEQS